MTLTHCCRRSFAHSHVFCAPGRRGDAFVQSWRASVGLRGAGAPCTGMVDGALAYVRAALVAHRVGWLWRSRWLDRGMRRCFRNSNVLCGCICFRPIRTGERAKACGYRWCSGFAYFALYFARTQSLRGGSIRAIGLCQPGLCQPGLWQSDLPGSFADMAYRSATAKTRLRRSSGQYYRQLRDYASIFGRVGRPAVRKRLNATRGGLGVGPR